MIAFISCCCAYNSFYDSAPTQAHNDSTNVQHAHTYLRIKRYMHAARYLLCCMHPLSCQLLYLQVIVVVAAVVVFDEFS